jgi:hypothetical protein
MQEAIVALLERTENMIALRSVKIRTLLSIVLAAPLAVVSLAIGDFPGMPAMVRYLVSPGFLFGINAAPSGSWIGDISNALRFAIAGNEIYYAVLIFLALGWFGGKKRATKSLRDDRVIEGPRQTS